MSSCRYLNFELIVIVHVIYLKTDHIVFEGINNGSIYSGLTVWLYYEPGALYGGDCPVPSQRLI